VMFHLHCRTAPEACTPLFPGTVCWDPQLMVLEPRDSLSFLEY